MQMNFFLFIYLLMSDDVFATFLGLWKACSSDVQKSIKLRSSTG